MKRIVITGIGVVSPIGIGLDNYYYSLKNNIDGITDITISEIKFKAGVVKDKRIKAKNKIFKFTEIACKEALNQSRLPDETISSDRFGLVTGTICGTMSSIIDSNSIHNNIKENSTLYDRVAIVNYKHNSITDYICKKFNIRGERCTVTNACSTGISILIHGIDLIMGNYCDGVMVTGVDLINAMTVLPLNSFRLLEKECIKPFDKNRKGTVIGEGCGTLILEDLNYALERGATIYGEILGADITNDATDNHSPSEDGGALVRAMKNALKQSNVNIEDIKYVNAHGTGTPKNDKIETKAIKEVFGDYANDLYVNSTKSFMGHTSAAAGILEVIAGMMALNEGLVHSTLNYKEFDEDCDLNYVPNGPKAIETDYFISNSVGFGGCNASIVIARYKGDLSNE